MAQRILPKYVTFVMEEIPLLRVVEQGGSVTDYEIKQEYLANLALLALSLSLRKPKEERLGGCNPLIGKEQGA